MKRKILFIISNLETGGVSKSMTSLLNVIDRNRYDVSLMLVSPSGIFQELLPENLRIITNPVWSALSDRLNGVKKLMCTGHPFLASGHFIRLMVSCLNRAWAARIIAALMPPVDEEFDTVVDFNGQQQLYYMIDKLKARKKVTFFHSDYEKWPYYYSADKKYFPMADRIFTVSDKCSQSLKKYFCAQAHKIDVFENISSKALIEKMSEVEVDDMDVDGVRLLTVGHVCENKGILWAIEAAALLRSRGVRFHWYFLGSVDNESAYNSLIRQNSVEGNITFLGIRTNPYPYIRKADIIVHPSKFEGRSIALDEARLLCKPVVVTNFSTVRDQFTDRYDASVCEMNSDSIADAIEELISDKDLRNCYVANLVKDVRDNSSEIEKLYAIFDD